MKKPKCKLCQSPHWTYEPHAINTAINEEERLTDAINVDKESTATGPTVSGAAATKDTDHGFRAGRVDMAANRTPNRRSRETYNSYMKDYMRAYRERSK